MAKRTTIGLCFFFDNNSNSGIVNYIYNIISGLNSLPDVVKPKVIVFYSSNAPVEYLKGIQYPHIKFLLFNNYPSSLMIRKANSLIKKLFKIDLYKNFRYFKKVDSIYPYFHFLDQGFKEAKNKIHWLVDFNNRAFPGHYEDSGISMNLYQQYVTSLQERVVLSSNSLLNELKNYYPRYQCDVKILKFASLLPNIKTVEATSLLEKYKLDVPYFMSPNQFWEHKNQSLVLEALNIIQNQYPNLTFKILFTGSIAVNRGKGYYAAKLMKKIVDFQLDKYIMFLGVIERNEQLLLMKNCTALIQPSLYEGWSTLVEEAKALNKFIILSDLPVHKEQINVNVDFFDPCNAKELADIMYKNLQYPPKTISTNYAIDIEDFGRSILNALTFN